MYPKNHPATNVADNGKFDVTLCSRILKYLILKPNNGWNKEPSDDDESFAANIIRIKMIRNNNWAHVHQFGIADSEMKQLKYFNTNDYPRGFSLFAKLEYAIHKLCKDSKEIQYYEDRINACCNSEIDEKTISKYKNEIANLMAKDLETHEFILKEAGERRKNDENIIRLIEESKKINKNNFDQIKNIQEKLLKYFENIDTIFNSLEIQEAVQTISNRLDEQQGCVSLLCDLYFQQNGVTNQNAEQISIPNCKNINITDFQSYFGSSFPNFKILILDYGELNIENDEKEKLIKSIAASKWNIIVDLNLNRSSSNIDTSICQASKKIKMNFLKKKIEEKESITDSDKYCIANNTLMCYFFLSDIVNFNEEFQTFLKELDLTQKQIMCTNLFLRENYEKKDYFDEIEDINKAVKSAVYKTNKKEILDLIYVFTDNRAKCCDIQNSFGKKLPNVEKKVFSCTLSKFISDMAPLSDDNEIVQHFLPSKDGQKMELTEDYNCYSSFIEVYHDKIGKVFKFID